MINSQTIDSTHTANDKRQLKTPVLFIVFKRLKTTQQVFEKIRLVKPPRLYISADGPRSERPDESTQTQAVRDFLLNSIDWDCEVKTRFSEKNLGCKYAVSSAITWFFENEPEGIILEDDCLPSTSFFWFCEELLERYRCDSRVWHIGSNNFQTVTRGDADYYFSRFSHIWGWASWADRWKAYDAELKFIESSEIENVDFSIMEEKTHWLSILKDLKENKIDTWDYQWLFTIWLNSGLAIVPQKNLVSNIGFGQDATHTLHESKHSNIATNEFTIHKHPSRISRDKDADAYTFWNLFHSKPRTFSQKIKDKISTIMNCLEPSK